MADTLTQRIEAASGTDRALDADIELAIGNWSPEHYEAWHRYQECGESVNSPMCVPVDPQWFTSSIDAALTLVPEGWRWNIETTADGAVSHVWKYKPVTSVQAFAATPALALCAAALHARITPMSDVDLDKLARGLTERQREGLSRGWCSVGVARGLKCKGLVSGYLGNDQYWVPLVETSLGDALKAHIERNGDDS